MSKTNEDTQTVILTKRIVLGTYAFMFTAKDLERRIAEGDPATHEWTCLLRAQNPEEDLSTIIRKVVFNLHPSFAQPQRTCDHSPFEISEIGWGEFEISCRIFPIDPEERPLDLKHYLKLYPDSTQDIRTISPPTTYRQTCVAVETRDEIIFRSPSEKMIQALLEKSPPLPPHHLAPHFLKDPQEQELEYIKMANLLRSHLLYEQENLKAAVTKRVLEVETLMQIHYVLHPETALQLLLSKPELLRSVCGGKAADSGEAARTLSSIQQTLRNLNSSSSNNTLSKHRTSEIIELYTTLVKNGFLAPLTNEKI